MAKKQIMNICIYALLIILVIMCIVPFYIMIINSTHSSFDIVTRLNLWVGGSLKENYERMQSNINIWSGFFNSVAITVPFTILVGYFGALTAYGFAKYSFRGKNILYIIVLSSMMMPAQLSIIGFYQLNLKLQLLNSYVPFIIPGIAKASAVFFMRGMIEQSIPTSLLEAGRVEGCSEFKIFNKLILPCVIPGIATMCIFNFVECWNRYIEPLVIMTDKEKYTMPVIIAMVRGLYLDNYGAMYLAIAISVVPIIIVYLFMSKFIISGLTMGSEK